MLEAVAVITVIAFACGLFLSLAARFLHTPGDPRMEALVDLLPGLNCGVCGCAGCVEFARALATGAVRPGMCPVCDAKKRRKIARFLKVDEGEGANRKAALVMCGGSDMASRRRFAYNGVADCAAAAATGGGDRTCVHGCLGYATCALACPVHAIAMLNGLAVVDVARCVSCGLCVATCPRKLIKMVAVGADAHVMCSSPEKGAVVRKVCTHGCTGCRVCVKNAPGAYVMAGAFLAARDYAQPPPENLCAAVETCPGKCIQIAGGAE